MSFGKKLVAYPLSVLFYAVYGFLLVVFHPVQWIALRFGYSAHKKVVDILNGLLVASLYILGTRIKFESKYKLDRNRPHIVVSNHQSTHDVTTLGWFFRKLHPKFIAKKELGKGIPSVSFNLKYGGAALIDRKDARQALSEIGKFAKNIEKKHWTGVIFPEGTRSRKGKPKRFSENGLKILTKFSKSALVVPVTINNSWKLWEYGQFPMNIGVKLTITTHEPIEVGSVDFQELLSTAEERIKDAVIS